MRFHVVALPHTMTSKEYSPCAYTQKVFNFCKMMLSLGHEVIHYGGEGSDVPCTEHISMISAEQREKWWGENNWRKEMFNIDWTGTEPYWIEANAVAIREIGRRIQPKDFICLIAGHCQKLIADAFPNNLSVEYGIGYQGTFSKYRVFESYAFQHFMYGRESVIFDQREGKYYDEVIQNYYDPTDFPEIFPKEDHYLFIGRLILLKGVAEAAEAVTRIGGRLKVAGQGAIKVEEKRISAKEVDIIGNVEYIGVLDARQRFAEMSKAKAVFVPTRYIGPFEGVAVEAMLCGTPVITTDWGAFAENVIDGVTGYRCRTLGEMMWAARECSKLDPHAIRDYALKKFSIDVVKYRYQDYFTKLMGLWDPGVGDWHGDNYNPVDKRLLGGFR
jgi:glycosyltransferase involved in cell wall biosynthesis